MKTMQLLWLMPFIALTIMPMNAQENDSDDAEIEEMMINEPAAFRKKEPRIDNNNEMVITNDHTQEEPYVQPSAKLEEGDEPDPRDLSEISLAGKDLSMFIGGRLKDDYFVYNRAYTLRSDFFDSNDFFRHKLNLDLVINQGEKKYGKPASQGCVRLTNYVLWQNESAYQPLSIDKIQATSLDNLTLTKNVQVKSLLPLIFVEQAWFKLNFDAFTDVFQDRPTSLKIGYFPYIVGRGVTLGFHKDLAVDYLGWSGEGGYTRYPVMPPGILFRTTLCDNLTWDLYYNLWRETNASIADTLAPTRQDRLTGQRPERGKGKNRTTWVTKLDYTKQNEDMGIFLAEPYAVYVSAPEQGIEFDADAGSRLFTGGVMLDWHYNGWSVNVEVAGQFGEQKVHGIDRNISQLDRSSRDGTLRATFSHVLVDDPLIAYNNTTNTAASRTGATDGGDANNTAPITLNRFIPTADYSFLTLTPENRNIADQGENIVLANGTPTRYALDAAVNLKLINSTIFANNRFRPDYKLTYQSFMALLDIAYEFEKAPFKVAMAGGFIGGDNYPYNNENNQTYRGFVPLRSRYRGLEVQNTLIFDRLVIPRPLNISYRTLSAFNNVKDLSNLQFLGLGATWFPLEERNKCTITADVMFLWEVAELKKWDKNGTHPDPAIEAQLVRLRNTPTTAAGVVTGPPTLFSGWETTEKASKMLGVEVDLKAMYHFLDHCDLFTKFCFFFPGQLYKDLDGQPNSITQRVDELGFQRFESLGNDWAFMFTLGLNYRF